MKKLFTLFLWLVWVTGISQPISLPITWDVGGVDYTTAPFGGTSSALVPDPLDPTNTVLRITKPQGNPFWSGVTLGNVAVNNAGFPVPIPMSAGNSTMTIRMRTNLPAGTQMMAKIENYTNGGIFVEKRVSTTVPAGQWENLVFDFSTGDQPINYANVYGKISIFPYFYCCADVPALADHNFWVDNVSMGLPPVISSFAPTSETTGNTVTITGSGFLGATAVSFGGSPAASFTVVNNNTITAVVGAGSSGAVKVTTPVSFTSLSGFTFIPPATAPTVSSFSPLSGATGATITITGTNFTTATAVNFGGVPAASFTIVNDNTITAVVASGNSGSVAVTNPDGFDALAGFTYIPPTPTVTSFTPTGAGQFGSVTITGTNFINVSAVTFGGTPAAGFTVVNSTTITATVGAGASGSVVVVNAGGNGSLGGFTFRAPIGLPITFGNPAVDYTTTDFGGPIQVSSIDVDPTNGSNQVLKIIKGAGAQLWAGTTLGKDFAPKVNNGGLSAPIPFTATGKIMTARVYSPMPVGTPIRCKVENTANGGISAEVDAFTTVQNGWSTLFWNLTGVNIANTYDKISFFMNFGTPGNAGTFYLDDVDYYPSPTISSFAPTSATTGNTVTITGTNFTGTTAVSFGGIPASSFTVVNSTTITAVVGLGASGSVSVTRGGVATLAGFTFTAPPTGAVVTSFAPTSAGETGVVTITGSNFLTATAVSFGGTAAASFTIVDDNTITAVVGTGASGSVSVTNPSGIGTLAGFTFIPKSPISLPITWDSPILVDYTTTDFGGNNSNVDADPTDGSNSVLRIVKPNGAQTWAGTTFGKVGVNDGGFPSAIPFTPANRFITARVYSTRPVGTLIMMKVEQGNAPAQNSEKAVATTVQNAWETMVFDFGSNTGGNPLNYFGVNYDKLSVFCNFGQTGTATSNTFYIDDVKFVPGPNITSFSPASAATGQTVTINGTNLINVTSVSFGGTPAASFTIVNNNQITAVVAAGTSGSVVVSNPVGSSSFAGFDYIAPPGAPTIVSFTPTSSIVGGIVTISGSNFTSATAVKFGGTNANSYTIVNSSTILANVGPGSTGSVSVTNSFGTGSKAGFTFLKKRIALPIIWDDFATVDYTPGDFCGLTSVLSVDPMEPGNTVMRMTKTPVSAACAGSVFGNNAMLNPIPFALGNTTISVRFYSPVAGLPVLLKLEGNAGPIEKLLTAEKVGWQVMEFDFAASANLTHIYNRLVFFPGFNQIAGANQISYVDNVIFGKFPANVWNGTTSSDFLTGSNWSLGFPPLDCNVNVHIKANTPFAPVLNSGNYGGGNVSMAYGASLTVNAGATYSICGNVLSGQITGAGTVIFNGTSAQTINGNVSVDNITVTKPAASGSVVINGSAKVQGLVTLSNATSNIQVAPAGKLILVSNASRTGSIAAIPAGASISGNVTQQRHLPGTGSGWYLVGTPIQGGDFSQWSDNLYMAAGTNLGGNQGVNPIGIQHSTIFKYDDALHNITSDTVQKRGWRVPDLSDLLTVGKGFRIWFKEYNTPSRIFDNVGPITSGDFNFPTLVRTEPSNCQINISPATISCTEEFRGWNFLANPYPSAIDWDATGGVWTKPGTMLNAFWRWNSVGGGYGAYVGGGSYVGAGPVPASPNLIPSSQGFFVKLSAPGEYTAVLSVKEGAKVNGTGTMLRTTVSGVPTLKIKLQKPSQTSGYHYLGEIRFAEDATDGLDTQKDVPSMAGGPFSFSMPVEGSALIANNLSSLVEEKTVPLQMAVAQSLGSYQFDFSGLETFESGTQIYLRDMVLGTIANITTNPVYSFNVWNQTEASANRFELVFSPNAVTSTISVLKGIEMSVYPNPSSGNEVMVALKGALRGKGHLTLTDVLGKTILVQDLDIQEGMNQKEINIKGVPAGMYSLRVKTELASFTKKLVIK